MTRKDTRKRKGDRHKPGYQTAYMRTWRAKQKEERLSCGVNADGVNGRA